MAPHGVGPLPKRHFACFRGPMQVIPGKDGFRLRLAWNVMAREIAETLIILKNHAAMLRAIPQAGLGLNAHVAARLLGQHILHMGNQRRTAGAPIAAHFRFGGVPAGRAKYQRTHGAC